MRVTLPLGQMYNRVFFIGAAYAIHGDTYVPVQPVSDGCVRIPMDIAAFFHTLVPTPGTPVYTSGSPWVTDVDPQRGTGTIVGVIGGYQEGGSTAAISYSPYLDEQIEQLYRQAAADETAEAG